MKDTLEIKPNIIMLSSKDAERKTFDSIFPLKKGTTYNAYLIIGSEKTALIDTVDPSKKDELILRLKEMKVKVDYIISNHSEQDHSGSIPYILEMFPTAEVVASKIGKGFLTDLLGVDENKIIEVGDNDKISLGDKTLKFIMFPSAHWPETMMTYLEEDKILFTCDVFGSHYSFENPYFTEEVLEYEKEYYAEIMMPFRKTINFNLKKLDNLDINLICPSHGPIHKEPQRVINLYKKWTSDETDKEVTIVYASMHGSTKKTVDYIVEKLAEEKIKTNVVDVSNFNISNLFTNLVSPHTLIIATPTVLGGPHPAITLVAMMLKAYRPKVKQVRLVTLYEWGSNAEKFLKDTLKDFNLAGSWKISGKPDEEKLKILDILVKEIKKEMSKNDG